jgi:hypothetical protein
MMHICLKYFWQIQIFDPIQILPLQIQLIQIQLIQITSQILILDYRSKVKMPNKFSLICLKATILKLTILSIIIRFF